MTTRTSHRVEYDTGAPIRDRFGDPHPSFERRQAMARSEDLDIVCCSLEPWDQIWRRNQHLSTELLRLRPGLRLLFAEAPVDVGWSLRQGRWPGPSALRRIGDSGRLWAMAPRKWLPRRVWSGGDRSLFRQVISASRTLGFDRPVLWINDSMYAPILESTGWPSVYDVTDDWLLGAAPSREMDRQRQNDALMLRDATEVVVCSPALRESRGRVRQVHLVPNGVDVDHLRAPTSRPPDLPTGRVVMYQGTLVDGRLDVDLCLAICGELGPRATLVFIGPNSLTRESTQALTAAGAAILGARPYADLPAYLQHADVLVVPHRVNPFTESLDPIKAREFLCIGRPVVSTPVAGFRDLDPSIVVADRESFVKEVSALLVRPSLAPGPGPLVSVPTSWASQAGRFLEVLDQAASGPAAPSPHELRR
jgi:glycosyltransferase involved in cell wall biosynthesis